MWLKSEIYSEEPIISPVLEELAFSADEPNFTADDYIDHFLIEDFNQLKSLYQPKQAPARISFRDKGFLYLPEDGLTAVGVTRWDLQESAIAAVPS